MNLLAFAARAGRRCHALCAVVGSGWGVLCASLRTGRDGLPTLAAKPQRLGRGGRRVLASAGLGLHLPANGAEQVDGGTLDLPRVDFARGHR